MNVEQSFVAITLMNMEHSFVAITPRSTPIRSGSNYYGLTYWSIWPFLKSLNRTTRNHLTMCKLFVLDRNTRRLITVCNIFLLEIITQSYVFLNDDYHSLIEAIKLLAKILSLSLHRKKKSSHAVKPTFQPTNQPTKIQWNLLINYLLTAFVEIVQRS